MEDKKDFQESVDFTQEVKQQPKEDQSPHLSMSSLQDQTQNKSLKKHKTLKFIAGLTIVSLVGGGAIGTSLAFALPYAQASYNQKNPKTSESGVLDTVQKDTHTNIQPVYTDNTITEIAKNIGPSVVSIYNNQKVSSEQYFFFGEQGDSNGDVTAGLGSGVIFKEDNQKFYIVTNAHVVEGADSLAVKFLGDKKVESKLVGQDTVSDIAVVEVNKADIPKETLENIAVAPLGDSDAIEVGQLAVAIGTPMEEAFNNTVTTGIISAKQREVSVSGKKLKLIQTDAAINPGNSGGALVGASGQVIGINTVKVVDSRVEGIGFAIPINTVKPIIEEILKNGSIVRPGLGITGTDVSNINAELYDLPIGVFVGDVLTGGTADLAGIKPYDVIIAIDNTNVKGMDELKAALNNKKVGDKVEITFIRDGKKKTAKATLKAMPEESTTTSR